MSQFYKSTQVPQAGMVRSNMPSGPTKDAQAHAEAQQETGGFAGAVMDLLGVANKAVSLKNKMSEEEEHYMEKKHKGEANGAVAELPSFYSAELPKLIGDKKVEDLTREELQAHLPELKKRYLESKNLKDVPYLPIVDKRINDLEGRLVERQLVANRKIKNQKGIDNFKRDLMVSLDQKDYTAADVADIIKSELDFRVGGGAEIEADPEYVKNMILPAIVEKAMLSDDPKHLLDKIDSAEMREVFDIDDYDNVVSMAKSEALNTINKRKAENFNRIEETLFVQAYKNGFKSEEEASYALKQMYNEAEQSGYAPSAKDIYNLGEKLKKTVKIVSAKENYKEAIKNHDYTALERSDLTKKEKVEVKESFFLEQTGLEGTSPQEIEAAIGSAQFDNQFKQYAQDGFPYPPSVTKYLNTRPTGGKEAIRKKVTAITNLMSMTEDSTNPIAGNMDVKAQGNILYLGNLIDKVDSGAIDEAQFQQIYSNYTNDQDRNTNSYGVYTSANAAPIIKENEEWLTEFSKDTPWSMDDTVVPQYVKRYMTNSMAQAIDAGLDTDAAKEQAEKWFKSQHTRFENPDGTESFLPKEFKDLDPEDVIDVVMSYEEVQKKLKADNSFESIFRNRVGIRPSANYEKTRKMEVFFAGQPMGISFNRDQYDVTFSQFYNDENLTVRKNHEARIKKKALEEKRMKEMFRGERKYK